MSRRSYKGYFKPKNPKKYNGNYANIIYRSLMERTLMKTLDVDPRIVEWQSEEIAIPYRSPVDGKMHRYFPDFCVRKKGSDGDVHGVIIEVKPYKQTIPPKPAKKQTSKSKSRYAREMMEYQKNLAKWEAAKEFARKNNMEFMILTERELHND